MIFSVSRAPRFVARTVLFFSLSLILSSVDLFAAARLPDGVKVNRLKGEWIQNGSSKRLRLNEIGGRLHVEARELARLSQAQLRWEPVSEQACFSRVDGLLCLEYGDSRAVLNKSDSESVAMVHGGRSLFIPAEFLESPLFARFTGTEIAFDAANRILKQDAPVTLAFPPVENIGDRYRIQVLFEEPLTYQLIDSGAKRVWIRFHRGRFADSRVLEGDEVVREVRIVQRRQSADMIVELGPDAGAHDLRFDKGENRLVLDVATVDGAAIRMARATPAAEAAPKAPVLPEAFVPAAPYGVKTVVVDAGHGGKDSGALGTRGTMEKDINLKVAKALANRLKKEKNIRVIMTRDSDEFIALAKRTEIANSARADLFVSIHCNSSLSSKADGFEVYFLSPKATDEAAAAVARIENSVVALEAPEERAGKIGELLASMAVYDFINESSKCAAHLCLGVKGHSDVRTTDVREANFYVLRGAQMPGVLVELEYLSNPVAELKLRSSRWRSKVVEGLATGVVNYLDRLPDRKPTVVSKK